MNDAVQKLVETFNGALAKTGGEAARVWPDMVARRKTRAGVCMFFTLLLGGVLALLSVYAFASGRAAVAASTSRYDDGYIGWFVMATVCFVGAVIALGIGAAAVSDFLYPEAAVVTDLVTSATSD